MAVVIKAHAHVHTAVLPFPPTPPHHSLSAALTPGVPSAEGCARTCSRELLSAAGRMLLRTLGGTGWRPREATVENYVPICAGESCSGSAAEAPSGGAFRGDGTHEGALSSLSSSQVTSIGRPSP